MKWNTRGRNKRSAGAKRTLRERRWKKSVNQVVRTLQQLALTDRVLLPSFLTPPSFHVEQKGERSVRCTDVQRAVAIRVILIPPLLYAYIISRVMSITRAYRMKYSIFHFVAGAPRQNSSRVTLKKKGKGRKKEKEKKDWSPDRHRTESCFLSRGKRNE